MQTIAYAAAVILYAVSAGLHWDVLRQPGRVGRVAWALAVAGTGSHLLGLIHALVSHGAAGITAMHVLPSTIGFVLALIAVVLGAPTLARSRVAGAFLLPVSMVMLAALVVQGAFGGPGVVEPVAPAIRPPLSPIHISASGLGFASFLLSYVLAGLYVLKDARLRGHRPGAGRLRLPPLQTLERLMYVILTVGFALYTLGAVLGALWATKEGGGGFSPKYTLAALSWLSFALVLGLRALTGWRGRRAAFLVALGFVANLAVVMSYFARLV